MNNIPTTKTVFFSINGAATPLPPQPALPWIQYLNPPSFTHRLSLVPCCYILDCSVSLAQEVAISTPNSC